MPKSDKKRQKATKKRQKVLKKCQNENVTSPIEIGPLNMSVTQLTTVHTVLAGNCSDIQEK